MICVLVCGGRDYTNKRHVDRTLDDLHAVYGIAKIVHGAYRGADRLAKQWAISRNIPEQGYPAAWGIYGPAAGPLRNAYMLEAEHPDLVVEFPGGDGTADMVEKATAAGITVFRAY